MHDRIGGIVRQAEEIRQAEIARMSQGSELGQDQRDAVDAMTRAIVKKVLHGPLSHLRGLAQAGDAEATQAVLRAFGEKADGQEDA